MSAHYKQIIALIAREYLRPALFAATGSTLALSLAFGAIEPSISFASGTATSQFTITQSVTNEVSFATPASNIVLSPSLGGITGGTSNGQTQVIVTTNDPSGYTMSLMASSSAGMLGNSAGGTIPAYVCTSAACATPDFAFTVPVNKAAFGYTVKASTTADLNISFKDNGSSTCGTGTNNTANACWVNASTTSRTLITTAAATAASGSTSTLQFRVQIQANPSPAIPTDTYVATTTLTVTAN